MKLKLLLLLLFFNECEEGGESPAVAEVEDKGEIEIMLLLCPPRLWPSRERPERALELCCFCLRFSETLSTSLGIPPEFSLE